MSHQIKEKVIQNLKDCNCNEQTIENFINAIEKGHKKKALCVLAEHRLELLNKVHQYDGWISCLDYLVYQIEKETV